MSARGPPQKRRTLAQEHVVVTITGERQRGCFLDHLGGDQLVRRPRDALLGGGLLGLFHLLAQYAQVLLCDLLLLRRQRAQIVEQSAVA